MVHIIIHSLILRQTHEAGEQQPEIIITIKTTTLFPVADKLIINVPFVSIVSEGTGSPHSQANVCLM